MSAATGGSFRRRAPARGAVVAGVAAALLLGTPGISPATASPAYAQVTNASLVFQAQPSFDIVGAAGQPWQIRNMVTKEILQTGTVDATQTVTPDLTTIGSHRRRRRKHHRVSEHAVLSPVLRGPHHVCRNAGENHHAKTMTAASASSAPLRPNITHLPACQLVPSRAACPRTAFLRCNELRAR